MLGAVLVEYVGVMDQGVHGLNARDLNARILGELYGRTEEGLNLERSTSSIVLVHGAWSCSRLNHGFDSLLTEAIWEGAALCTGQGDQFVHDARDQCASACLFKEFCVIRGFKEDAGGMEGDGSVLGQLMCMASTYSRQCIRTYPIMRSYCCCLMFSDTLQST